MERHVGTPRGDAKLTILTKGLDVDFEAIEEYATAIEQGMKVNRSTFSDKHHIDPDASERELIQDELILEDDDGQSITKVYFKDDSPLLLTADGGEMYLEEKQTGERIGDLRVSPVPIWSYESETYEGTPLKEFVSVVGVDRISWAPFVGCQEFVGGDQCKFCGLSPGRMDFDTPKPNVLDIETEYGGDTAAWWDDYVDLVRDGTVAALDRIGDDDIGPHEHFMVLSGNLDDKNFEWEMALDVMEHAVETGVIDFAELDSYWNLFPPDDISMIDRARELGFQQVQFNLEVFDRDRFREVNPGKSEGYGYEKLREALRYAAETFGHGNARTNMVLGAEPIDDLVAGAEELASEGVVVDYSVFFPRPASKWSDRDPPEPAEVIRAAEAISDVYADYGYDPLYCGLSSRSSIANVVQETRQ